MTAEFQHRLPNPNRHEWGPQLDTISTAYDAEYGVLSYYLHGDPRPAFTHRVLADIGRLQRAIQEQAGTIDGLASSQPISYLVAASGAPEGMSLGGDIEFFIRAIRHRNRGALSAYARMSIDVLYANLRHCSKPLTTIALLTGATL